MPTVDLSLVKGYPTGRSGSPKSESEAEPGQAPGVDAYRGFDSKSDSGRNYSTGAWGTGALNAEALADKYGLDRSQEGYGEGHIWGRDASGKDIYIGKSNMGLASNSTLIGNHSKQANPNEVNHSSSGDNLSSYGDIKGAILVEWDGGSGATKDSSKLDLSRIQARSKSEAYKKSVKEDTNKPEPETVIPNSAVINTENKSVNATINKVKKAPRPSAGNMRSSGEFNVGDITQNVGKKGDMKTTIIDSTIGENASIGNDNSSTEGVVNAGNVLREMSSPGASYTGKRFSDFRNMRSPGLAGAFNAGDINQNVGKQGDMDTTIRNSTIGQGVSIGNDYSTTMGNVNAGNRFTARRRAQQYGFSGSSELTFS